MLQLMRTTPVRLRILISTVIGVASAVFCWFLLRRLHQGAADFTWAIRAAQHLLAGKNPYDTPLEQYPLTAALFGLPLVLLRPEVAAALFYGISSALLALGLTRQGYTRLLIFLAYPYWAGMLTAQWAPLIAASAFFPILLPATLAKPQIGLPVALTHLSRRGALACLVFLLLTLIALPRWPLLWIHQLGYYEHFTPLVVLPGPLLILALLRPSCLSAGFSTHSFSGSSRKLGARFCLRRSSVGEPASGAGTSTRTALTKWEDGQCCSFIFRCLSLYWHGHPRNARHAVQAADFSTVRRFWREISRLIAQIQNSITIAIKL